MLGLSALDVLVWFAFDVTFAFDVWFVCGINSFKEGAMFEY